MIMSYMRHQPSWLIFHFPISHAFTNSVCTSHGLKSSVNMKSAPYSSKEFCIVKFHWRHSSYIYSKHLSYLNPRPHESQWSLTSKEFFISILRSFIEGVHVSNTIMDVYAMCWPSVNKWSVPTRNVLHSLTFLPSTRSWETCMAHIRACFIPG